MDSNDANPDRRNLPEGVRVLDPGITGTNRRRFLKAIGGSTAAGLAFSGTAAADDDDDEEDGEEDDDDEDDDDEDDDEGEDAELPNSMRITGIGDDDGGDDDDEEDDDEDDDDDDDGRTEYGVTVTGEVSGNEEEDDDDDDDDSERSVARGVVTSGTDKYRFSGRVKSITDYETFQVDVDYGAGTINIESNSGMDIDYELTVTGDLNRTPSLEGDDTISGETATGEVEGGNDTYEFTGNLGELVINGVFRAVFTWRPDRALGQKLSALERLYGPRVDREVDTSTETTETGRYIYYDGTEVPYRAELLNGEDVQVTVDGETFYFPGGDQ